MEQADSLALKQELIEYSRRIVQKGLAAGPGGNTSIRDGETMWISPSGYSLDEIPQDKWVPVRIDNGAVEHPTLRPSSEVAMHLYIYQRRDDVQAIVHTHPPVTIGIISAGHDGIPPMFPDYVALIGDIPFIDYVVPCSEELAQAVVHHMQTPGCSGLFMKNHGLITVGNSIKQAYYRTELIEDSAKIFWISKTVGSPRTLTAQEQQEILNLEAEKYRQRLFDGTLTAEG